MISNMLRGSYDGTQSRAEYRTSSIDFTNGFDMRPCPGGTYSIIDNLTGREHNVSREVAENAWNAYQKFRSEGFPRSFSFTTIVPHSTGGSVKQGSDEDRAEYLRRVKQEEVLTNKKLLLL